MSNVLDIMTDNQIVTLIDSADIVLLDMIADNYLDDSDNYHLLSKTIFKMADLEIHKTWYHTRLPRMIELFTIMYKKYIGGVLDASVFYTTENALLVLVSRFPIHANNGELQDIYEMLAGTDRAKIFETEFPGDWYYSRELYNFEGANEELRFDAARKLSGQRRIVRAYRSSNPYDHKLREILMNKMTKKSNRFWFRYLSLAETTEECVNICMQLTLHDIDNKTFAKALELIADKNQFSRYWQTNTIRRIVESHLGFTERIYGDIIPRLLLNTNNWVVQSALLDEVKSMTVLKIVLRKTKSHKVRERALSLILKEYTNRLKSFWDAETDLCSEILSKKKFFKLWAPIYRFIPDERKMDYAGELLAYKGLQNTHGTYNELADNIVYSGYIEDDRKYQILKTISQKNFDEQDFDRFIIASSHLVFDEDLFNKIYTQLVNDSLYYYSSLSYRLSDANERAAILFRKFANFMMDNYGLEDINEMIIELNEKASKSYYSRNPMALQLIGCLTNEQLETMVLLSDFPPYRAALRDAD